ncbi:MAG: type IV pilus assembly protein PilM [Natronincolaceae bacterium]|jgi:type IV pilus assembly protein PilM
MKKYISGLLEKNIIAIDIGTYSIKIVEGSHNVNTVQINKMVTVPTPADTFYNGEITDRKKIEQIIAETLIRENIKAKNAAFTLESTEAISREIVLPWAKPRELEQIIGFEVEQYLPIEMDKYILQYKIIDEFEEEGVKKVTVLVVALPMEISKNYLDLGKNAGLTPYYLDIHSNTVHKLLLPKTVVNDSYPLEEQTIAAIDLGHQFINVTVINKGLFEFSRLLNKGGRDIDIGISGLFNLSLEEAETRKKEIKNINRDTEQDSSAMLITIVEETVLNWLDEIQKVFMYYTSRSTDNVIDSICIYGGSSDIEGISTYIQEFFNMPTFRINSLSNIKFNNNPEGASVSNYINAIGAIIRR